jgi:uncharacterized protein YceK
MTRALACGLVACALTGCGTVQNFARPGGGEQRPLEVYGGTTRSVDALKATVTDPVAVALSCSSPFAFAAAGALVLDVPLSAVADTVTLPITLWAKVDRAYVSELPDQPTTNQWREFWFNEQPAPKSAEGMP